MSFAGKVWRLLVGIKDALALAFLLLFFVGLFMLLSLRPNPGEVRTGALLLKLNGSVVEEVAPFSPWSAVLSSAAPTKQFAARDLVRAIDTAGRDKRIKALALDMSTFTGGGQVHMEAIAAAIDRFRAARKPVLAYAIAYSDDSVLLAAHASEVWVDPLGGAAVTGPGGERLYYAGLLDKLKIKARVYRVGTYKSAVEPYIRSDMSPAARENATAYLATLWQEWQANVKLARPQANIALVTQQVPQWIAANNGDLARAAVQAGLVDKVGTLVDWGRRVAQVAGRDAWDKTPGNFAKTDLDAWLAANPPAGSKRSLTGGTAPIGVITIAGEISDGDAGPGEAGAERIVRLLDDSLTKKFKALVVRVDSPGGSVTGSEAIRRAILRQKARGIPVAVSMGNVAASGGYWISTPADRIFAEPDTITGSIGIFGVVPTFEDALAQWGVTSDGVRTTPLSGQPDLLAGFTPEAEAVLQASVTAGYQRFLSLVAASRHMTPQRADELAQGRVWDGGSARQLGLVDQFGGLDDAVAWAAGQAKLKDGGWHAEYLGANEDPYAPLIRRIFKRDDHRVGGDMFSLFAARENQRVARVLADLNGLLSVRGMQARCLECPSPALRPVAPSLAGAGMLERIARTLFE
ncbi:MAG: signal peptide peptidase SppA [Croceibacterium sp.]